MRKLLALLLVLCFCSVSIAGTEWSLGRPIESENTFTEWALGQPVARAAFGFPIGYTKYQVVTIDNTKVPSTRTNYQVLIDLADLDKATDIFDTCREDFGDIRITLDDGVTLLAWEPVDPNKTDKTGEIWVTVPSLSGSVDTDLWIWYNGIDPMPAADSTYGSEAVWADYEMVQHFNEDPSGSAPQMLDSTANDHDGTSNGTMLTADLVAAQVGKGLDLDGTDDYISIPDSAGFDFSGEFTFMYWFEADVADRDDISQRFDTSSDDGWMVWKDDFSSGRWRFSVEVADVLDHVDSDSPPTTNFTWAAGVRESDGDMLLYLDGSVQTDTDTRGGAIDSDGDLNLGTNYNASLGFMDGVLDEVWVIEDAPAASWFTTMHNNMSSPSTFYSVGSEQEVVPYVPVYDISSDANQAFLSTDSTTIMEPLTITNDPCESGIYAATDIMIRIPDALTMEWDSSWTYISVPPILDDYGIANYSTNDLDVVTSDVSGIAHNPVTNTIFVIENLVGKIYEYERDGTHLRTITTTGLSDAEDIKWMSQVDANTHTYVIADEPNTLYVIDINDVETSINMSNGTEIPVHISYSPGKGIEGAVHNPIDDLFYVSVEKQADGTDPGRVFSVDWDGNATFNADVNSTLDSGAYKDLSSIDFCRASQHLILLGDEDAKVIEITVGGTIIDTKSVSGFTQPEGVAVTLDTSGLFVVGEADDYTEWTRSTNKVAATVTFEDSNSVAVIDVTTNFAVGESVTIGGLYFMNFATSGPDNLELVLDGSASGDTAATDDKTKTVTSDQSIIPIIMHHRRNFFYKQ